MHISLVTTLGAQSMRFAAIAGVLCLAAGANAAEAVPCAPSDVTGLFIGSAKTSSETADVTLNLFCSNSGYSAQLFTSMGDFPVKSAASDAGHVTVAFDSGASLGTLHLTREGAGLGGSFSFADDKGTIALTRKSDALAEDAMKPRLDLTPAQWHEDLHVLAQELPKLHANAFFLLSPAQFEAEIAALSKRLETANSDEIFVGLQQILRSIGDGHTGLGTPPPDRRAMPIEVARFGEDFRIVSVGPGLDKLLGARIMKIGRLPIGGVWRRALTLTPQGELLELRESNALIYLARGYALHGLGITPDRNHATSTVNVFSESSSSV